LAVSGSPLSTAQLMQARPQIISSVKRCTRRFLPSRRPAATTQRAMICSFRHLPASMPNVHPISSRAARALRDAQVVSHGTTERGNGSGPGRSRAKLKACEITLGGAAQLGDGAGIPD
jgi:hypothetical protein